MILRFKTIKFYKVKQVPEIIVNLDNREIVKISVSSLDYLSLHSKDVAQNFIRQLFNKNVFLARIEIALRNYKVIKELLGKIKDK